MRRWSLLLLPLLIAVLFAGCGDSDSPTGGGTALTGAEQFTAMLAAGEAYINDSGSCPGVVSAATVQSNLDDYTVVDIRSESAYDAGHIEGAIHSSLGTLIADLADGTIPLTKDVLFVCYSGQSAGHAKIAAEMLYDSVDFFSMGFGMSSWNSDLAAPWNTHTGNNLPVAETADQNGGLTTTYDFPTLSTGATSAEEVVESRVATMLTNGFKGKAYADISATLNDYFIINYFGQPDYLGNNAASGVPGHIPGAYQFTPYLSLGGTQMLENVPTDMPIIVYCWTGQHSSQVTAYLNMLGYEAYSLTYGSNNLFYDDLNEHKWGPTQINEFPLEMTVTEAFEALAGPAGDYVDSGDCPGVIGATTLHDNLEDYTVVDIRSLADYDAGHIDGAIHSSLSTLLADIDAGTIPTDKDIVIACYTGQTAGHAKIALDLLYDEIDIYSLKWGMASWNNSLAFKWTDAVGNALLVIETEDQNDGLTRHAFPKLDAYAPATALEERVEWMLDEGFKGKSYAEIADDLEAYFVVNYFGADDYLGNNAATTGVPGHIPGAYQFTPGSSLDYAEMLHNLPTDMPIVVYCWTGQTSSQIAAYLNMLGYEAYSLKFGSNNLFYDNLNAHKWNEGVESHAFTLVPTS